MGTLNGMVPVQLGCSGGEGSHPINSVEAKRSLKKNVYIYVPPTDMATKKAPMSHSGIKGRHSLLLFGLGQAVDESKAPKHKLSAA